MVTVFSNVAYRMNNSFMKNMMSYNCEDRINSLSNQIATLEFKLELVLTKCRLGLANNNNKLSTL